jgi:hypothetical protein
MATVIEVDCSTGISTEREQTAEEVAQMEAMQAAQAAAAHEAEVEAAAKAEAKTALLAKLGITEDEAKLLLA